MFFNPEVMRIALVHLRHAKSGGTERYLDRVSKYLAERGHAVTIVCRSHAEPSHPALRFERLRPLAIGGSWRFWSFARAVEKHVAQADYDVVYGLGRTWSQDVLRMGGGCQRTYLALAHDATRTPLERALLLGKLKHAVSVRLEERALDPRGAGARTRVIVNSEMVRRDVLARYALDPARVITIHNGVDLERFHPRLAAPGAAGAALRAELGLGADELAVLFLGTGYARKGLDLVLAAFPALLAAEPRARLVVCGFDSAGPRYAARAAELGIAHAARFLGGRLDPEAVYAACDLYVLPTRCDPFANSTLEALASGLPVITSATNGGAELLSPGVDGAVVDVLAPTAVEALAAELCAWGRGDRARAARAAARALAERHDEASKFAAAERVLAEAARARIGAESGAERGIGAHMSIS
jgi:UDP-glucose:(heptosyl)LPS alpha-1,3-glucosyltransferase